jgi:transposase
MKAYSNDLRSKIVEAYESNDYSQQEVARLFGVSKATVKNYVRRKRETGSTDALPRAGGNRPVLNEAAREYVREVVKEDNDLTLEEICRRVGRKHKKKVSVSAMCRLLQRLGLPRKKRRSMLQSKRQQECNRREASISKR